MSYNHDNLEKSLKDYPDMITLKKTETILDQIKNCIFKIHTSDGGHGTGFFCLIYDEVEQKDIKVMITNHHVIGNDYLNDGIIKISLNNEEKIMDIKIDSSRKKYTNKEYDITIIEIKKNDNIKDNSFLKIDGNIYQDNPSDFFKKKSIYIIQYPDYLDSSVSYGILKSIEENFEIKHLCTTNQGSSGSPIINLDNNKVIGVHKASSQLNFNKGTFLKNPINEFLSKDKTNINSNNVLSDDSKKKSEDKDIKFDTKKEEVKEDKKIEKKKKRIKMIDLKEH